MNGSVRIIALAFAFAIVTSASAAEKPSDKPPIEGIEDNSFLVEEAYNQDPGVVQHIFNAVYSRDPNRRGWTFNFTQEWPLYGL